MTAKPDEAIRELGRLHLLDQVLLEIANLAGIEQSPPHHEDVLNHTVHVLRWLVALETALFTDEVVGEVVNQAWTVVCSYREPLVQHLTRSVDGGLDGRVVLRLAALFHDIGKAETFMQGDDGRIRFYGHDEAGAELTGRRLRELCFSKDAINQVKRIVAGHMRPLSLAQAQGENLSRRAAYRYFRDLHENGLDVALLSLADHLATHQGTGDQEQWQGLLGLVRQLLRFWFEQHEEAVKPVPLIGGRDLIELLGMEPGPEVGRILRLIEESQAAGDVQTRTEALRLAREQLL
jgi:poly(A) polymerase/tRNA nucleotidyltransferase (CCA-adding enzyme)